MRSRPVVALLATLVVGLAAVLVAAAVRERPIAFTLGVPGNSVAATLTAGQELCQAPIAVPEGAGFDGVGIIVGTFRGPGSPLEVRVVGANGRTMGRGRLAGGYADNRGHEVHVGVVPAPRLVRVCVRDLGHRRIGLYGGPPQASPSTAATIDGHSNPSDISLVFVRSHPRSLLSLADDMVRRAALFHGGWVGPWTYWLLTGLVTFGVGALLALAVRGASAAEPPKSD